MKANAITRIVLYSLLTVFLVAVLLSSLNIQGFFRNTGSGTTVVSGDVTVDPDQIRNLEIDWAAGSVTIRAEDTDTILFSENGSYKESCSMGYSVQGNTLRIHYSTANQWIGFGNTPSKNLVITVPTDWVCESLKIDGAALELDIHSLNCGTVELDGAGIELTYRGTLDTLDCDSMGCVLDIVSDSAPSQISMDGMGCELALTLPEGCGYAVQLDGVGCSFRSDAESTSANGCYYYGDRHCRVDADGMGCTVGIYYGEPQLGITENDP